MDIEEIEILEKALSGEHTFDRSAVKQLRIAVREILKHLKMDVMARVVSADEHRKPAVEIPVSDVKPEFCRIMDSILAEKKLMFEADNREQTILAVHEDEWTTLITNERYAEYIRWEQDRFTGHRKPFIGGTEIYRTTNEKDRRLPIDHD